MTQKTGAGLRWGLALLLVSQVFGCGGSGAATARVSGTVTRNGKPVPNVLVQFQPEQGRVSTGLTDEQGHFTLKYDRKQEGAVAGTHRVSVTFRPKTPKDEQLLGEGKWSPHPDYAAIMEKYGKADSTPLRIEIKEGDNSDVQIKLD